MDDRHEQYCPNCSGVSPTGGYCASCLAMLTAAERGDNSPWLQEDNITAFGRDDDDGDEAFGGDGDEAFGGDGDDGDENGFAAKLVDHHIFPREFEDLFKKPDVDIDIHEHTVTMYAFQHWAVHSDGWNADWNMFFEMYREAGIDPRREEVVAYGEFLKDKFGFADIPFHDYNDKSGDLGSHIM